MGNGNADRDFSAFDFAEIAAINASLVGDFFLRLLQAVSSFAKGCSQFIVDFFGLAFGQHVIYCRLSPTNVYGL